MHYYNFHIGDYKSHTHHLTIIEDIAFRRLLDHYYLHESPIKQRNIARQIGMLEYEQDVLSVLNEFFHDTPDGYIHPRADEEIAKYRELSNAGKRGAAKRWNSPPMATPWPPHSPPNATPIATNNQEPITKNHIYTDFEKVLKAKNKTLTETLIASIQAEANKANLAIEDAIKICCERGWSTFKAEWIAPKIDIIHQTVPSKPGRDPILVKLENDAKNSVAMPDEIKARFKMIKTNG
jgi:uncharacterized protein YdaU (DUF1376 family)